MTIAIKQINQHNIELMSTLMTVFSEAFSDTVTYTQKRPSTDYLKTLINSDYFIALAALKDDQVIGGLTAYELKKFEQERSQIYIYDLAINAMHRRKGVATALIEELKIIAAARGAYVIFVQADTGEEDKPAISLYTKLGKRENVLHFDIDVDTANAKS